jgi:hypothetical protein
MNTILVLTGFILIVALILAPIIDDGQYKGFKLYLQSLGCVMIGVCFLGLLLGAASLFGYLLFGGIE